MRRLVPGQAALVYAVRDARWADLELTLEAAGVGDTRIRLRSVSPENRRSEIEGWRLAVTTSGRSEPVVATTNAAGIAVLAGIEPAELTSGQLMLFPPSLAAIERWSEAARSLVALAASSGGVPSTQLRSLYEQLERPVPDTRIEIGEGQIRLDEAQRTLAIPVTLKDLQGLPDQRYVGRTLLMVANVGEGRGTTLASLKLTAASATLMVDVDDDSLLPLVQSLGVAGLQGLSAWVRFVLGADDWSSAPEPA